MIVKAADRAKNAPRHFNVERQINLYQVDAWPGDTAYVSHGPFSGYGYRFDSTGQWVVSGKGVT